MSFDFFGQGFKTQNSIVFTKQQNQFLSSKLHLLDPKQTGKISIGTVLQFLKFSGIKSQIIQKIIKNSKIQSGKKQISHEQMKKIFRGVALFQNHIEPSTINIQANIKTKPPIFYDDQSDQEPVSNKQAQPKSILIPQKVINKSVSEKRTQQIPSNDSFFPVPIQVNPSKPPQAPKQNINNQENLLNKKIKQFQIQWASLKTKGNLIQGSQVKNLCKNFAQRQNLSKAWKLCCLTHSGSLTKGQFFAFLQILGGDKIPQALPQQIKNIILLINKDNKQKTIPKSNNVISSPLESSQMFDNSDKIKATKPQQSKKDIFVDFSNITSKALIKVEQVKKKSIQNSINNNNEIQNIRNSQTNMNMMLQQVDKFLQNVNEKNNNILNQLFELKKNQQNLNNKFNNVCININKVIIKQNSIIQQMMKQMTTQQNISNQKINYLQQQINNFQVNQKKQLKQGQIQRQSVQEKNQKKIQNIQKQQNKNEDERNKQQNKDQNNKVEVVQSEQQLIRLQTKQKYVLQLINFLSPISEQQYPRIANIVIQYTQQQLNTAYSSLLKRVQQKQKLQAEQAKQAEQRAKLQKSQRSKPQIDQFNSTNFAPSNPNQTQDMFA